MFINYFRDWGSAAPADYRPFRWLFGLYAIWKLLSYDWFRLDDWPLFMVDPFGMDGRIHLMLLYVEFPVALVSLALFTIGRWAKWTSLIASIVLTHMLAVHLEITNSGGTWLWPIYTLALYAVHDGDEPQVLRWGLLIMALVYFFTGWAKLINAGVSWAAPSNFSIILHQEKYMHLGELPLLAEWIIRWKWLALTLGVLTLILEIGFVFAVTCRMPLAPWIFGLAGMHVGIALAMGVFFFDQFIYYLFYVRWSRVPEYPSCTKKALFPNEEEVKRTIC